MKTNPILLLMLCISLFLNSQEPTYYYLPDNIDSLKSYLKQINSNQIDRIDGDFSSKIKKVFKDRDELIFESFEDSAYIFNPKIDDYIGKVLNEIYKSNPEINTDDFKFFVKNSITPNAACYGDGMFEINIGLLSRLEAEDELAFVICHEIAHKILDHPLKNVSRGVALINSKETKDKVKDIQKQEYGQTRAALLVLDELKIDMLDYSKEVEAQADSMGYVLFSKTKYQKYKSVNSLEKLIRVDEMVFHQDIKLDSVFDFDMYPFQSYWLKKATSLFDTDDQINEFSLVSDTLKTHPEIEFRVKKLIQDFNLSNDDSMSIDHLYSEIKNEANKQSVLSAIDLNHLDLALYELIEKRKKEEIDDNFYYSQMAQILQSIYTAKKKHDLGKYVPQTNGFSDEKQLNSIRLFLHNLELKEVQKIGFAFCEENGAKVNDNKKFTDSFNFFITLNN